MGYDKFILIFIYDKHFTLTVNFQLMFYIFHKLKLFMKSMTAEFRFLDKYWKCYLAIKINLCGNIYYVENIINNIIKFSNFLTSLKVIKILHLYKYKTSTLI